MIETSIIIRTFNEERHIGNLLQAIREQNYSNHEIILVDSGSTDDTLKIAKKFCDKILQIESRDFTFGYSLNVGCRNSRGKYIVLISAHTQPTNKQWLTNLLSPFSDQKVAMVYGKQIGTQDAKFSEKRDFERLFSSKLNISSHYANNANSAIRKELWEKHPFDENLLGLEDIEWAKHFIKKDFIVSYQPEATIYHIHNEKWPQIFNRYRREAIAAREIGLSCPPQSCPDFFWLSKRIIQDSIVAFNNACLNKLKEICLFRYYQWKGTRQGWCHDKNINLNQEKYSLYYPAVNQAVVITSKRQVCLREMPLPEVKPGDVLIKVAYVGVCKTDLEVYDGTLGYYKQGIAKYPIIPGHEFSGTIVSVGANSVKHFNAGDRVIGECILSCGVCDFCKKGLHTACLKRREVGVMNCDGAYARFIVLPAQYVHRIPDGIDLKTACLSEPLAVVLRSIRRIAYRLKRNDRCAIIGAGSIGNFCSQALLNLGHNVTLFDKSNDRLNFLKNLAIKTKQELDELKKFDVIIEATGSTDALKQALEGSKANTTILLLGFPYGRMDYNFEDIVAKEKVIVGSVGGAFEDFEEALKLLPKIDTAPFTQKILPLDKFSEAWKLQQNLKYLKIILKA